MMGDDRRHGASLSDRGMIMILRTTSNYHDRHGGSYRFKFKLSP
jgi:hypothetical protein